MQAVLQHTMSVSLAALAQNLLRLLEADTLALAPDRGTISGTTSTSCSREATVGELPSEVMKDLYDVVCALRRWKENIATHAEIAAQRACAVISRTHRQPPQTRRYAPP